MIINMTAVDYLGIAGPDDECAKHGKEHMVYLENLNCEMIMSDGTKHIIRKGTWVCRACTGEEYFKELKGWQDETV